MASVPTRDSSADRGCLAALGLLLRKVASASTAGLVASGSFFRENVVNADENHEDSVLLAVLSALAPVLRNVAALIPGLLLHNLSDLSALSGSAMTACLLQVWA